MTLCRLVQGQKQKQIITIDMLPAIGGWTTKSIFPEVEAWLKEKSMAKAFEYIVGDKKNIRYRSVIDFLLCELLPEYKEPCIRYYKGKGPQLIDVIAERIRLRVVKTMLSALNMMQETYLNKENISWNKFLRKFNQYGA